MTDQLFAALDPDPDGLAGLHERLAREADRTGVLDIGYTTVDTPVGRLLLAATDAGLLRVAYAREDHDAVLEQLGVRVSPRILRSAARLSRAASQLERYFEGTLRQFDVPLDLRLAEGFRRDVLLHLARIDYGRTESYAEVALATGSPRAVRAVGSACARNPLPVVVPCHRVVRSDGAPGEYVGGAETKRALLALEQRVA